MNWSKWMHLRKCNQCSQKHKQRFKSSNLRVSTKKPNLRTAQKPMALYQREEWKNKHSFCDNNLWQYTETDLFHYDISQTLHLWKTRFSTKGELQTWTPLCVRNYIYVQNLVFRTFLSFINLLVRACACAIGVFQTRWYHYNHWLFLFFFFFFLFLSAALTVLTERVVVGF